MMNGNHFADSVIPAMSEFYAGTKHVAIVLHASVPADRDKMERRLQEAFAHIGVPKGTSLHKLDGPGAIALLREVDAIFISGGEIHLHCFVNCRKQDNWKSFKSRHWQVSSREEPVLAQMFWAL